MTKHYEVTYNVKLNDGRICERFVNTSSKRALTPKEMESRMKRHCAGHSGEFVNMKSSICRYTFK
jgi:hypothetical protein